MVILNRLKQEEEEKKLKKELEEIERVSATKILKFNNYGQLLDFNATPASSI